MELLTGAEWTKLQPNQQERYVEDAVYFWREKGFPYPSLSFDEIEKQFLSLQKKETNSIFLLNNEMSTSNVGLSLANTFHPQMWSTKFKGYLSPKQVFDSDRLLKKAIQKSLRLWPDRKAISERCLRDILRTYSHTRRVSNFRPVIAKALYERYSSNGDNILDFCAGYSGRLLGCLSLNRSYIGIDPSHLQYLGLQKTINSLKDISTSGINASIINGCAEDEMQKIKSESFSLIFSSPPYYDLEPYSEEETQSYIKHQSYSQWRDNFLKEIIENSFRILKKGGVFIINVKNTPKFPIATDTLFFASKHFNFRDELKMRLATLPYGNLRSQGKFHYEPIFVFQK